MLITVADQPSRAEYEFCTSKKSINKIDVQILLSELVV